MGTFQEQCTKAGKLIEEDPLRAYLMRRAQYALMDDLLKAMDYGESAAVGRPMTKLTTISGL